MSVTLTHHQEQAIDKIKYWYQKSDQQTFFLSGYAGTGKTTLIKPILDALGVSIFHTALACLTGKASLVLDQKLHQHGLAYLDVTTIHKLIYYLSGETKDGPVFRPKPDREMRDYDLIIIDEASMVNKSLYDDLLFYGIKILFIGDIGQLPPVNKDNPQQIVFDDPDYLLTDIHRQNADNPIIDLSYKARKGIPIDFGCYGDNIVQVISHNDFVGNPDFRDQAYLNADQIICGKNRTRHTINQRVRRLHGFTHDLPEEGDKLICMKNNWDVLIGASPLVNGYIGRVGAIYSKTEHTMRMRFESLDDAGAARTLRIARAPFESQDQGYRRTMHQKKNTESFDFGYAVTCHKSQGSEWRNVLVHNEVLDPEMHARWLYTAITRASERLIIVV